VNLFLEITVYINNNMIKKNRIFCFVNSIVARLNVETGSNRNHNIMKEKNIGTFSILGFIRINSKRPIVAIKKTSTVNAHCPYNKIGTKTTKAIAADRIRFTIDMSHLKCPRNVFSVLYNQKGLVEINVH